MKSKEQWEKELLVRSDYPAFEWIGEVQEDATHELRSQLAAKIAELEKLRAHYEFKIKIAIASLMALRGPNDSWKRFGDDQYNMVIVRLSNLLSGPFTTEDAISVQKDNDLQVRHEPTTRPTAHVTSTETARMDYQGEAFRLAKELELVKAEREKALAACAEMRGALRMAREMICDAREQVATASSVGVSACSSLQWIYSADTRTAIDKCLSSDCGKGWLPPEVGKELVRALKMASEELGPRSDTLQLIIGKALAHAKEHGIE